MQWQGMLERHQDSIANLARLGFLARAVTYATIGLLAIQVALSQGGKLTDTNGAFLTLVSQPFGKLLLGLVGLGFAGYALWRLVMAFAPLELPFEGPAYTANPWPGSSSRAAGPSMPERPAWFKRIGYGFNGLVHAGLALSAFRMVMMNQIGSGDAVRTWSGKLMAMPLGLWAVGICGLIVAGIGLYELFRAFKERFREHIDLSELSSRARDGFCRLAKWGILARGLVFCLIGGFLIRAAILHNPSQARGLGGALAAIATQPYGKLMLILVATGLLLFAAFSAFEARYYRLEAGA